MSMRKGWLPRWRRHTGLLGVLPCHPEKVSVLAAPTNGLLDRDMSVDAARQLWARPRGG
jgi:hypothetical protein